MIEVAPNFFLDEKELEETFVRASGPGGQNVNKVSSAVQLRFNVRGSPNLPESVRARLERLAGRRLTREGVIVIIAQRFRTQERNRADALERLGALVAEAAIVPVHRRATRPPPRSRRQRLADKARRAAAKAGRVVMLDD